MSDTNGLEHKSNDVTRLAKLARMLQSMLRRFPKAYLIGTSGDFGVRLDDDRSLNIVCNGRWSDEDLRDFLVLFATWLAIDPRGLRERDFPLAGVSQTVKERLQQ